MSDSASFFRLPPRPDLEWREDGVPRAQGFDDVYFSTSSGLEETREVFFRGCGLPEAWMERHRFTVAELGFGSGLNIAALVALWSEHRPDPQAHLDIVSFEGRPMTREEAEKALAPWRDELDEQISTMLAQWPARARGVQQMQLGHGARLALHVDEVLPALKQAVFCADAWFLDGFSPAKNADMWSEGVMREVARLSSPGAQIGTYTVAGAVRRALGSAGFRVEKKAGFGRKRERLEAVLPQAIAQAVADPCHLDVAPERPKTVVIIGAGIMGACLAQRFAAEGANIVVVDKAASIKDGASANPLGLAMPRLDAGDTPLARAMLDAFLLARQVYAAFPHAAHAIAIEQPASDPQMAARHDKILKDPPLDETLLAALENEAGLLHLGGMVVDPIALRQCLLEDVEIRWGQDVRAVRPGSPAAVALGSGEVIEADLVVLAAGMGGRNLLSTGAPPLDGRAGQLEWGRREASAACARASGRYAIDLDGVLLFGASFTPCKDDQAPMPDLALRRENLEGLAAISPALAAEAEQLALTSRTGVRATTPDRAPVVGRVMDEAAFEACYGADLQTGRGLSAAMHCTYLPGVMMAGGLGARGFTWAPFLADIAVSLACGAPAPTGRAGLEALSPSRFYMRAAKRRS